MTDTDRDEVGTSALRCADVRQIFLDSAATNKVLIVDCCFAGRAIESTMSGTADAVLAEVDVQGTFTLAATARNANWPRRPTGCATPVFTGELLSILRDGLPGGPELITLDLLYRELRAGLAAPQPANAQFGRPHHHRPPGAGQERGRCRTTEGRPLTRWPMRKPWPARHTTWRWTGSPTRDCRRSPSWRTGPPISRRSRRRTMRGTAVTELAAGLLERRDELRGRLGAHLALAVRLGIAEDG